MKRLLVLVAATSAALAGCNGHDFGMNANAGGPGQSVDAQRIAETADEKQQRKPLPDASLTAIVRSALISDTSLDVNKIDVENKAGNVALYGSVQTPREREKAERIVMSVGGVKSVANNLTVNEGSASSGSGSTTPRSGN